MCCSGSTFKTQREAECHPKAEGQRWILPWDGHFFSSFCTLKFLSSSSENYCIRPSLWRAENLNNYPPGSPRGLQSHLCISDYLQNSTMVLMFVVSLRPLQLRGVAVGPAPVPPMPPRLNGAQQPGTALRSHGHANQHAQSSGWPQCSSEPWIRLQGLRTSTLSPTICTFFLLLLYFEFSWYFWCLRVRFEDKQDNQMPANFSTLSSHLFQWVTHR